MRDLLRANPELYARIEQKVLVHYGVRTEPAAAADAAAPAAKAAAEGGADEAPKTGRGRRAAATD